MTQHDDSQPLTITYRKIIAISPDPRNARTHPKRQIEQIKASITEFGFANPILIDADGLIIAGHGRLRAAKDLGLDEVPTIVLSGLTVAQTRALRLADNKIALGAGWAVSNRMKRDLAIRALNMAIAFRAPPKGCIHHTDRGSQYCSHDYQKILRQHGFKVSMSGNGNCYDNAAVETFFKTIKAELIWRRSWETRRQAEMAIFEYINGFYNPRRRHSALGWKSPVAFERKVA